MKYAVATFATQSGCAENLFALATITQGIYTITLLSHYIQCSDLYGLPGDWIPE